MPTKFAMFVCLHSKPWYKTLLSKVRYDPETKEAVGAEAIMNIWLLKENGTIVSGNKLTLISSHSLSYCKFTQNAKKIN